MTRPVQHTAAAVAGWLREGRRVVAGLLVEVEGSSPLDVGASMYIDDQGGIEGSITGGCVEGAVAAAAMDIIESDGEPQLVTYGISDELAGHGRPDVRRDRPHLHPRAQGRARARPSCSTSRRPSSIAPRRWSRCSTASTPGAKLYVDADGATGSLGCGELLDKNARREAQGLLAEGRSSMRDFGTDGASLGSAACASTRRSRPSRRGWSSSARSTSPPRSRRWPRASATASRSPTRAPPSSRRSRFSAAAETEVGWPDKVLDGVELGPRDAVLIFTHDPEARRPRRAGRARRPAPATSARSAAATRPRTATAGCATSGVTDERDRARLRPLRAGHRRLHRGGDGRRRAGRDHRPPRRAPRTTVAGSRRADPPR